jgi:hypothetical protein
VLGAAPKPGQDLRQLGGQDVARVHADHLPQLHGRAAQVRQAVGDARHIGWGQQHVADARPLTVGKPPRPFGDHSAGNAAGQPSELSEPRQPAAWHCAAPSIIVAHDR